MTVEPNALPSDISYAIGVPSALVIGDGESAAQAVAAAEVAGLRVTACVPLRDAAAQLDRQARCDVVLLEAADGDDSLLDAVLEAVEAAAEAQDVALVVTASEAQIDRCFAAAAGPRRQLLCRPSLADRVAALVVARSDTGTRVHDVTRDGEGSRLQRLSEEVARIAEALARLTREEEPRAAAVRAPASGYRGPEPVDETADASAAEIRATIRARRLRSQFFEGELFADPAWDMLLDLFAATLERRRVSVSSLCMAAAVPPTTALRWIATMHEHGLFERQADPADRRRAYIALSAKGLEGMRGYVRAAKRAGLAIV